MMTCIQMLFGGMVWGDVVVTRGTCDSIVKGKKYLRNILTWLDVTSAFHSDRYYYVKADIGHGQWSSVECVLNMMAGEMEMLFWLRFFEGVELSFYFDDSLLLTLSLVFLGENCRCFSFIALDSSFFVNLFTLYGHLSKKTSDRMGMIIMLVVWWSDMKSVELQLCTQM